MKNILVIDDEPLKMRFWWDALSVAGYRVTSARTTDEAVMRYNADGFDLIVIDRQMIPGAPLRGDMKRASVYTGELMLKDIRTRRHLSAVPTIMFTNYYDEQTAKMLCSKHDRFVMEPKTTSVDDFVALCTKMIQSHPVSESAVRIPDDEPPNLAPYYVMDVLTDEPVRVVFKHCELGDEDFLTTESGQSGWLYSDVVKAWLQNETTSAQVLKLVRHDGADTEVMGLFHCSIMDVMHAPWWRLITFESSPKHKAGEENRRYAGVGRVLIARFLREWLWRNDLLFQEIFLDSATFGDDGVLLHESKAVAKFLEHLGFKWQESKKSFTISSEAATDVLDAATRHPREQSRRLSVM